MFEFGLIMIGAGFVLCLWLTMGSWAEEAEQGDRPALKRGNRR
jgi:hypothetical protein